MSGRHEFHYHVFNDTDHLQILRDEETSEYVKDLIGDLNRELRLADPFLSVVH